MPAHMVQIRTAEDQQLFNLNPMQQQPPPPDQGEEMWNTHTPGGWAPAPIDPSAAGVQDGSGSSQGYHTTG